MSESSPLDDDAYKKIIRKHVASVMRRLRKKCKHCGGYFFPNKRAVYCPYCARKPPSKRYWWAKGKKLREEKEKMRQRTAT